MSEDNQNNSSQANNAQSSNNTDQATIALSEKPTVDFSRLFAQDNNYGNTNIKGHVIYNSKTPTSTPRK